MQHTAAGNDRKHIHISAEDFKNEIQIRSSRYRRTHVYSLALRSIRHKDWIQPELKCMLRPLLGSLLPIQQIPRTNLVTTHQRTHDFWLSKSRSASIPKLDKKRSHIPSIPLQFNIRTTILIQKPRKLNSGFFLILFCMEVKPPNDGFIATFHVAAEDELLVLELPLDNSIREMRWPDKVVVDERTRHVNRNSVEILEMEGIKFAEMHDEWDVSGDLVEILCQRFGVGDSLEDFLVAVPVSDAESIMQELPRNGVVSSNSLSFVFPKGEHTNFRQNVDDNTCLRTTRKTVTGNVGSRNVEILEFETIRELTCKTIGDAKSKVGATTHISVPSLFDGWMAGLTCLNDRIKIEGGKGALGIADEVVDGPLCDIEQELDLFVGCVGAAVGSGCEFSVGCCQEVVEGSHDG